jgi:uncharacterized protein (TIGR03435 family)
MADRFNIDATFTPGMIPTLKPGEPVSDQLRGMLRTLLEDRFRLKVRMEVRQVQVYALVVVRPFQFVSLPMDVPDDVVRHNDQLRTCTSAASATLQFIFSSAFL